MRMAKADEEDFESTNTFLHACENLWASRRAYSLHNNETGWVDWDDDDKDKIELLEIRENLAKQDGCDELDVDSRLVIYEFIKRKYRQCDNNWARVTLAARILIDSVCDPQKDYLDYSPYLEEMHVAPEQ